MKQYSQQSIHNVALLGHGGSGKTTLADAVLCYGKATERIGKIADSTTVMDFDPEEKKRKTSVSTSVYALELGGHKLNIIDAPGLFDFAGGVSEALAAADSAVIAVSGKSGLTTGAKQSFQKARALKKAVAFFVGKLDSTHAHFYRVISSLVANYGAVICPVVIPYIENDEVKSYIDLITNKAYACDGLELKELRMPVSNEADEMRSMLLEAIATADDALMEKYFAGEEFTPEVKREAEVVRNAGGLFIIGTERHESRRIDNQLRGRAGRQGDPGASRFFLSLEDDLMRIFGGDRVQSLMDSLGLDEDVPIENKLITNTIESAQKKLEASNFAIRKQVLQYDDVMNQQREIIYKQRQMVLDGEDISDKLHEMMKQSIDETCESFLSGETADDWDFAALRRHYLNWLCLPTDFNYTAEQLNDLKREDVAKVLYERGMSILESKEQKYGAPMMRELERICLLRNVDSKWMEHIDNMDQLKQGMGLRGYGQHDPVVEYRIEGFAMFDEMIASIREDAVHMLLTIEIRQQNAEPKREQIAKPTGDNAPGDTGAKAPAPVRVTKIGRNDPCPCGSGLKWKKCTCKEYHPDL